MMDVLGSSPSRKREAPAEAVEARDLKRFRAGSVLDGIFERHRLRRNPELEAGDRVIALMRRDFRTISGWSPRSWQYDMFNMYVGGLLQYAYWDQWGSSKAEILRRNGEPNQPKTLILSAPRREGKTAAVTLILALAVVHVCEHMKNILVIAQSVDQAKNFADMIRDWVLLLEKRYDCTIVASSAPTKTEYYRPSFRGLAADNDHEPYWRKVMPVTICSSNGIGKRGHSPGLIAVDEFYFTKREFMEKQIVPMLREREVVLFGLSSLSYDTSILELFGVDMFQQHLPKAQRRKDNREQINEILAKNLDALSEADRRSNLVELSKLVKREASVTRSRTLHVRNWCDACLAAYGLGSESVPTEGACRHNIHRVDPNIDDMVFTMQMLSKCGKSMARELRNIPDVDDDIAFNPRLVDAFLTAQPVRITTTEQPDVYLFIDPTNGTRSQVACVGLAHEARSGVFSVIALGSYTVRYDTLVNATTEQLVGAMASRLRADPRFRHSTVYVMVENNACQGWISPIVTQMMKQNECIVRVQTINASGGKRGGFVSGTAGAPVNLFNDEVVHDGVATTQVNKHLAVNYTLQLMRSSRLRLCEDTIQVYDFQDAEVTDLAETLAAQLKAVRKRHTKSGGTSYTGKGGGLCDDLAVCLVMAVHWSMTIQDQMEPSAQHKIKTGQFILSL